jgi:hypothetical protein
MSGFSQSCGDGGEGDGTYSDEGTLLFDEFISET